MEQTLTPSQKSNVLIAGCGAIGHAVGLALLRDGHDVWGLRRDSGRIPPPIRPLKADVTNPETLQNLPPVIDSIIIILTAGKFDDAAYARTYVGGTKNLLAAFAAQGIRPARVLFVSSTSVYGQTNGEWVDETSATQPLDFSGKRMLEAEEVVAGGPYPHVIIRFAGIYGVGRIRFVQQVRDGTAAFDPTQVRYRNVIHNDDVVGIIRHVHAHPRPAPLYIGVDDEPVAAHDLVQWISSQLKIALPPIRPVSIQPGRRNPGNKRCRNMRLHDAGYAFKYPTFRDGYDAIIAAM